MLCIKYLILVCYPCWPLSLPKGDFYVPRKRHVHKYKTVVDIGKIEKTIFYYKLIKFLLKKLKFSGNMHFSYSERLALAKV